MYVTGFGDTRISSSNYIMDRWREAIYFSDDEGSNSNNGNNGIFKRRKFLLAGSLNSCGRDNDENRLFDKVEEKIMTIPGTAEMMTSIVTSLTSPKTIAKLGSSRGRYINVLNFTTITIFIVAVVTSVAIIVFSRLKQRKKRRVKYKPLSEMELLLDNRFGWDGGGTI